MSNNDKKTPPITKARNKASTSPAHRKPVTPPPSNKS